MASEPSVPPEEEGHEDDEPSRGEEEELLGARHGALGARLRGRGVSLNNIPRLRGQSSLRERGVPTMACSSRKPKSGLRLSRLISRLSPRTKYLPVGMVRGPNVSIHGSPP